MLFLHQSSGIFRPLINLEVLDLSRNGLKYFNPDHFPLKIQMLNLSWNSLSKFEPSVSYLNLKELVIAHNLLEKFWLPSNITSSVSLAFNQLRDIRLWNWASKTKDVDLRFNLPECSCQFKNFHYQSQTNKINNFEHCFFDGIGSLILTELMPCSNSNELVRYIDSCPIYTRLVLDPSINEDSYFEETIINCTNKNLSNFSTNFMKTVLYSHKQAKRVSFYFDGNPLLTSLPIIPTSYWILPSTEFRIYAMNSAIKTINEYHIIRNLKILNVTNNQITKISLGALEQLTNTKVALSGNPIICTCDTIDEYNKMHELSIIFSDYHDITCHDGPLLGSGREICVTNQQFLLYLLLSILSIIVLMTTFYMKYALEIKVIAHSRFCWLRRVNRSGLNRSSRKYKAFISFAQEDEEIVKQIINHLEEDVRMRFCVHLRDWKVGERIDRQVGLNVFSEL